jgi:plasmid stabilization system protein ParE
MKSLPLLISPRASRQIEEIVDWYERQHEGLGQSFYAELSRTFHTISLMPEMFRRVRG